MHPAAFVEHQQFVTGMKMQLLSAPTDIALQGVSVVLLNHKAYLEPDQNRVLTALGLPYCHRMLLLLALSVPSSAGCNAPFTATCNGPANVCNQSMLELSDLLHIMEAAMPTSRANEGEQCQFSYNACPHMQHQSSGVMIGGHLVQGQRGDHTW